MIDNSQKKYWSTLYDEYVVVCIKCCEWSVEQEEKRKQERDSRRRPWKNVGKDDFPE